MIDSTTIDAHAPGTPLPPPDAPGVAIVRVVRDVESGQPIEIEACSVRTVPDTAAEVGRLHPPPRGLCWATAEVKPGEAVGRKCPTRPDWKHYWLRLVPIPARVAG